MIKFMNFMNQWEFMHVWMKFPKIRSYMHEFPFVHKIHKFDHGDDLVIMAMTGCWSCMKISFMAVFMTPTNSTIIKIFLHCRWRTHVIWKRLTKCLWLTPLLIRMSIPWLMILLRNISGVGNKTNTTFLTSSELLKMLEWADCWECPAIWKISPQKVSSPFISFTRTLKSCARFKLKIYWPLWWTLDSLCMKFPCGPVRVLCIGFVMWANSLSCRQCFSA